MMRAHLETKCGCTQIVKVPFPPPDVIHFALFPDKSACFMALDPITHFDPIETRTFQCKSFTDTFAEYREVCNG